jgi:hypothetical protein
MTTDAAGRWGEALDRFEASIEACTALVAMVRVGGADPPALPVLTLPTDAGPPPPALAARAGELIARSHAIEAKLTCLRDDVAAELAARTRVAHVYGTAPSGERLDQLG